MAGESRVPLAGRRLTAAVRRRRLERQTTALGRLLKASSQAGDDYLPKLLAVSDVLGWPTVDERAAVAYVRIKIAAASPNVHAGLRKSLKSLAQRTLEQLRRESEIRAPRGRRQKLSPAQGRDVYLVYRGLLAFFRDPAHQPQPDHPKERHLLGMINAELSRFSAPGGLTLAQLEPLTEETHPNRIAKAVAGAVYRVSAAQIDKIVTRVGRTISSPHQ